jgi:uncharacterized membrane protein
VIGPACGRFTAFSLCLFDGLVNRIPEKRKNVVANRGFCGIMMLLSAALRSDAS